MHRTVTGGTAQVGVQLLQAPRHICLAKSHSEAVAASGTVRVKHGVRRQQDTRLFDTPLTETVHALAGLEPAAHACVGAETTHSAIAVRFCWPHIGNISSSPDALQSYAYSPDQANGASRGSVPLKHVSAPVKECIQQVQVALNNGHVPLQYLLLLS